MNVEKESQPCPSCGYPAYAGHGPDCQAGSKSEAKESEKTTTILRVDFSDKKNIAAYYQFEIDQGFSSVHPKSSFEKMVDFRQQQMRDNQLAVAVAREGEEIVGTAVVVLENGTMGKEIAADEAWHAGFVTDKSRQGQGIGAKLLGEQDNIAREAGKLAILTRIEKATYPSMRACLKHGYRLNGIDEPEQAGGETDYRYRKDLIREAEPNADWVQEVVQGRLAPVAGKINESSPPQILVDPENPALVKEALQNSYEGVYLLRPEDFKEEARPIEHNLIVFTKADNGGK